MVGLTDFRKNTRKHFLEAKEKPIEIKRNTEMYVLCSREHYIDLLNKVKFPNLMHSPVQTTVHFVTTSNKSG
jgi:hypothetical protein